MTNSFEDWHDASVKCDICGRTIPLSNAHVINSGGYTHPILRITFEHDVIYCNDCYVKKMDDLARIGKLGSIRE